MPRYTVTFTRIIESTIYRYVKPKCTSNEVEISFDLDTGDGQIFVGGLHSGGTFTIAETTASS